MLLACLAGGEMGHAALMACAERRLEGNFDGAIGWYPGSVKLDLEASGVIERTGKGKTLRFSLKQ